MNISKRRWQQPLVVLSSAGVALLAIGGLTATPAGAGPIVDPDTLQPAPPPGAECRADGRWTICHTGVVIDAVDEPAFDAPCGTIYETIHDVRRGIRWYNDDGQLVKRFVTQDAEGTWSLSPAADQPTASLSAHANWRNVYAVPGDDSTGPMVVHGDGLTVQAPGYGVIVHIAGLDLPDGEHRGVVRFGDAELDKLCTALTG